MATGEDRTWEDAYRNRWAHDKIVRSTHGVNCTGSCSWKIYVKGGIVTWETQQTDYPRTRWDMPNHEPRGCARGASYSWYLYSANRVKYPMVRGRLLKSWREARLAHDPVDAWASIVEDDAKRRDYQQVRGLGGFVRSSWDEVNEIVAAANVYTIKKHGPDRIIGFSPIPAMSMVSYAAGSRYLSLIGGVCMSFYDWYCDLPPSSPQVWGEQTDVPESADWFNSSFIIAWGSNVPQTRTPDAHFFTEVRYKGTKTVAVTPDYSEVAKLADIWMNPKQGTDAAVAMAMGHVILKEFYFPDEGKERSAYFDDYVRRYTDMPMLVMLKEHTLPSGEVITVPDRYVRASDFNGKLGQANNPEWKTVALRRGGQGGAARTAPSAFAGAPTDVPTKASGTSKPRKRATASEVKLKLSLLEGEHPSAETAKVGFPYFGGIVSEHFPEQPADGCAGAHGARAAHRAGQGRREREALVATVFDLQVANYGVARGLAGEFAAKDFDDDTPYTPAWQERITGTPRAQLITVARQFADNAHKTHGKSMVIIGAAMNHWYHSDMNYRGVINMLMMCGCIGQSGGGWAHYVGQEKLRPQTGWTALAFALDWIRPPRQMNSTSFFYAHTDQWRYEKLGMEEVISPLADKEALRRQHDRLQRARRAHGLAAERRRNCRPTRCRWCATRQTAGHGAQGLRGQGPQGRLAEDELHRPRPSRQLAAQHVRVALQHPRLERQGPRIFPQAFARHQQRRAGQRPGSGGSQAHRSGVARQGPGRQARPAGHARLPHEHHVPVFATSCCPPPPGTRRTISIPATCTRSSIRCRPRSIRPGNRAATGTSTRASRRNSAKSASATWASNASWC